jgi:hypothetical protein
MIIRALDLDGDWTFGLGKQNYLQDNNAIALNIKTRILEFLNDCFFNTSAGLDWFRLLGTRNTVQEIILNCRGVILQSEGVMKLTKIDAVFNPQSRILTLSYAVDTVYTLNQNSGPLVQTFEVNQNA